MRSVYPPMLRYALLVLALVLVGCVEAPIVFHGSASFTPAERAAIQEGADFLASHSTARQVEVVWDLADGDAPQLSIVKAPRVREHELGYTEGNRITIDVEEMRRGGMPIETLPFIAAHEFAHFFGMQHHDTPGLMNGYVDPAMRLSWSDNDTKECARVGACK